MTMNKATGIIKMKGKACIKILCHHAVLRMDVADFV